MKCIFCDFILGKRKKHLHGLPFKLLNITKNSVSFLAMDIPTTEDGHILVMPKRHFSAIEDIPRAIQTELMEHVSLVLKLLRKNHSGCNILLNDGKSAGQTVPHAHFPIIPRQKGDKIKIEVWKHKKLNKEMFENLQNKLIKNFLNI
jgi:histidine triad (HIT) family protein